MKGILFKPEMHGAIREDRKTVMRQTAGLNEINKHPDAWIAREVADENGRWWFTTKPLLNTRTILPRYQVGDIVYIEEAWAVDAVWDNTKPSLINPLDPIWYPLGSDLMNIPQWVGKLRSPLFMPAWAARDFSQITDVRACQTRDITFEDCLAEGIVATKEWQELSKGDNYKPPLPPNPQDLSNEEADKEIERGWIEYARQAYFRLYDSINGKGAHEKNWDFRYEFKRVAKPTGLGEPK